MQTKKRSSVNLEKRRSIHIQIGLLVSLSIVLVSLEWTTAQDARGVEIGALQGSVIDEEIIPLIPRKEEVKPVLPQLKIPVPVEDYIPDEPIDINIFNPEDITKPYSIYFPTEELPEEEIVEPLDRTQVQIMAEFPGGEAAMMKWIYSNIKYPEECVQNGIQGKVTAKFTISKFGEVQDIVIARSVHPDLDAEVIRVLKLMPKFSPAIQNQNLVPVYMYWPVIFRLN